MTIASKVFGAIGPKVYTPDGPLGTSGNTPLGAFDFGEVVFGDKESQFIFLQFNAPSAVTINQGDVMVWDDSFSAAIAVAAASQHVPGSGVGTFYLGGRYGDPAAAPNANAGNIWSYTFTPGVWGIWVQRFGASLVNYGTITAQADTTFTTATFGQVSALATAGTHGATIPNMFAAAASLTFTATTTLGSNVLTAVSGIRGIVKGMSISATNLPAGCFIQDITGATIVVGNTLNSAGPNATATGATQTITAYNGSCWATFATGALTAKVSGTYGVYPNATVTGTGIASSTLLSSITGNFGNLTANLSVATTAAEATPVLLTASIYVEGFLRLPYISVQS
jgi:hypothetical protein